MHRLHLTGLRLLRRPFAMLLAGAVLDASFAAADEAAKPPAKTAPPAQVEVVRLEAVPLSKETGWNLIPAIAEGGVIYSKAGSGKEGAAAPANELEFTA